MKNNEYYLCIEDNELGSFLSFCEVNNITFGRGSRLPLGETTFVLKDNEVKVVELSDDDYCDDWDGFVEEYYSNLFSGMSTKKIINKLKSDRYSFDGSSFIYGELCLDPEYFLGCLDTIGYELLEIMFESDQLICHPEKPTTEYKSYCDFNPLKRA
jgi:hypothetical protein